jgi:hypothetical protein
MFRESSAIDSERTASGVRALYAKYSENEEWFTGTPDSVDRRIAQCKRIANAAKAASVRLAGRNAGIQYIALAQEMDSDRTALEGLRRDLLTASSDRYAEEGFSFGSGDQSVDKGTIDGPPVNDGSGPPMESPLVHQDHLHQGSRHIAEARFFIAEQECDDLGELLIRAQNHAERVSSTLPARQSRAHVASFVEAVSHEFRTANPYARNGHQPTSNTVSTKCSRCDKFSHDWNEPCPGSWEATGKGQGTKGHDKEGKAFGMTRQASLNDFPADLMYLE